MSRNKIGFKDDRVFKDIDDNEVGIGDKVVVQYYDELRKGTVHHYSDMRVMIKLDNGWMRQIVTGQREKVLLLEKAK